MDWIPVTGLNLRNTHVYIAKNTGRFNTRREWLRRCGLNPVSDDEEIREGDRCRLDANLNLKCPTD